MTDPASNDLFSIEGKTAVITGGSRGIGKMIATGYVKAGAKVYISSRKVAACEETVAELSEFGDIVAIPADLVGRIEGKSSLGRLGLLIHTTAGFVDAGWEPARQFTLDLVLDIIIDGARRPGQGDFKTQLQELSAELELGTPTYRIAGSGPDHDKRFTAVAIVGGTSFGEGDGTSKKRAEQSAARSAWLALSKNLTEDRNVDHSLNDCDEPSDSNQDNRKAERNGTA